MEKESNESSNEELVDTVIIGAGPSGLCCAYTLQQLNIPFKLLEMGKCLTSRDRNDSFDSANGAGGAGLFSDGKFSFYPAGTALWELDEQELLQESYEFLEKVFQDSCGFEIPKYTHSKNELANAQNNFDDKKFELKIYPSFYLSLELRIKLIEYLEKDCAGSLLTESQVLDFAALEKDNPLDVATYKVEIKSLNTNCLSEILCKRIIIAGGRFHSLFLPRSLPRIFRRYEYGLRIEGSSALFRRNLLEKDTKTQLIDPKWIFNKNERLQYRTFCVCEEGEVVKVTHETYEAFSGRADCPEPTGNTNFGLNVRVKTPDLINFNKILNSAPFNLKLSVESGGEIANLSEISLVLATHYGEEGTEPLIEALQELFKQFVHLEGDFELIGPTIEGVGEYADLDVANLKVCGTEQIYAIGDASGIFRGIIPSMLSGIYLAKSFLEEDI